MPKMIPSHKIAQHLKATGYTSKLVFIPNPKDEEETSQNAETETESDPMRPVHYPAAVVLSQLLPGM